jgi:hypothetical protein
VNPARLADVDHLRGVLLEMRTVDADVAEPTVDGEGLVVLADLVALRQVGIEVVLAVEDGSGRHLALERRRDHQPVADRLFVDRRQGPRMTEADRAGVDVGLIAEGARTAAEHLGPGGELDVDLQPDHRLVAVLRRHSPHPLTVASSAPK